MNIYRMNICKVKKHYSIKSNIYLFFIFLNEYLPNVLHFIYSSSSSSDNTAFTG